MSQRLTTICAAATAALFMASPVLAGSDLSPLGSWQVTTGEARYTVVSCGDNGEICAKLTWLRSDARTAENMQYLNQYVVKGVPTRENKWTGTVKYEGENIGGSVTMVNSNTLRLTGCKLIACNSMEFTRI